MSYNALMCQPLLYGRSYKVAFRNLGATSQPVYGNINTDNKNLSAIRVAFEINKAAQGAANTGQVTLYNINQQHRNTLKRGSIVELSAGYQGQAKLLIVGSVLTATSKRDGPNITTTLELVDGLLANTYAKIDKSYGPGTHISEIITDIADAMKAQLDVLDGYIDGLPDVVFRRGYHAQGAARDVLEDLLLRIGLEGFVNNGKLYIIRRRGHLNTKLITLSANTGLLGIPSINYEHVDFEALLNPDLAPGQLVSIETANTSIANTYKIRSCVMSGDTHDTTWSVKCKSVLHTETIVKADGTVIRGTNNVDARTPFQKFIDPTPAPNKPGILDARF